jgi:hypothetical protein
MPAPPCAEAQQGEGDGPALKCQYPDCLDGYLQEFSAEGLRVKGNPCPTCHGEKP